MEAKNIGLNEIIKAMIENGTDNVEANYKTQDGLEITLDIVMTKAVKNGKILYVVETENEDESYM